MLKTYDLFKEGYIYFSTKSSQLRWMRAKYLNLIFQLWTTREWASCCYVSGLVRNINGWQGTLYGQISQKKSKNILTQG